MRKLIATLLAAASLTTPALAQRGRDPDSGIQAAPERSYNREQRAERPSAQARTEAPRQQQQQGQQQQALRQERGQIRQDFRQDVRGQQQDVRSDWRNGQADNRQQFQRERMGAVQEARQNRGDVRQNATQDRRDWQRDRQDWQNNRGQGRDNWQNRDAGQNRGGSQWNGGRTTRGSWNREWRRDPRYNWQDWRQRNRGSYHFPQYFAPRGWSFGYNRFALGAYLSAPLFAQNYWIDDPYEYQLPPAYGPYRWVRYYDDALLVDVRNGLVVDTIYDFFW